MSTATRLSDWLVPLRSGDSGASVVCIPHAGGGTAAFRELARQLPSGTPVFAVRLPGRESRYGEPCAASVEEVVDAVVTELDRIPGQVVVFGHSMGAVVGYEVCRRLADEGWPRVRHLVVSGHRAPQLAGSARRLSELDDHTLLRELALLDGIPPGLLRDSDLVAVVVPALRADLRLLEGYVWRPGRQLACPVTAVAGRDDPEVHGVEDLLPWLALTTADGRAERVPGAHFPIPAGSVGALCAGLASRGQEVNHSHRYAC